MVTNNSVNTQFPVRFVQYITGLDLTSNGSTKIFTTPNWINSFIAESIAVQISTSNTFISAASISLGSNGASYNNILAITALTGLSVVGNYLHIPIVALAGGIPPSTDVFVNVTAAVATALTGKILVFGVNV